MMACLRSWAALNPEASTFVAVAGLDHGSSGRQLEGDFVICWWWCWFSLQYVDTIRHTHAQETTHVLAKRVFLLKVHVR
jgi:hypothetical protein